MTANLLQAQAGDVSQQSRVCLCCRAFNCDYRRTDTAQKLSKGHQASGTRDERGRKEVSEKRRGYDSEILRVFQGPEEEGLAEEKRVGILLLFAVILLFRVSFELKLFFQKRVGRSEEQCHVVQNENMSIELFTFSHLQKTKCYGLRRTTKWI